MNILFLHFPIDNNQVESKSLPDYFATKGHNVYSCFEKGERNFYSKHCGVNLPVVSVRKEKIKEEKFDLIVCKNDSFQKYGKLFRKSGTIVINVAPMGFQHNYQNCDYYFKEDEIIRAPWPEMRDVFNREYVNWESRENQIIVAGTIGSDKNQKEIVDFVDRSLVNNFRFVFAGKIYSSAYADYLHRTLARKGIESEFKFLNKIDLSREFLKSKLAMLTTDPRPVQPFDPGPRVIFESIAAGTPCIVNDLIKVHHHCLPYCEVYKNRDKSSFEKALHSFFKKDNNTISESAYNTGKKYLTIEYACHDAYKRIMTQF